MVAIERRSLLIGGAAIGLGAATGLVAANRGWWEVPILSSPNPDSALLRFSLRNEARLIRWYDQALSTPGFESDARLTSFRSHHLDHLTALGGSAGDIEDLETIDSAALPAAELPVDAAEFPTFFAEQESLAAEVDKTSCRISSEGTVARLFALIGASETAHSVVWSRG